MTSPITLTNYAPKGGYGVDNIFGGALVALIDFAPIGNVSDFNLRYNVNGTIRGSTYGSATKVVPWNNGTDSSNGGYVEMWKRTSIVAKDDAGSVLQNAKVYVQDVDDGNRTNITGTFSNASNWVPTRVYQWNTDASGLGSYQDILIATYSLITTNGANTVKSGRTVGGIGTGDSLIFKSCHYNKLLKSDSESLAGVGTFAKAVTLLPDLFITEPSRTVALAYTSIDTAAQFYDRAKAWLWTNFVGQTSLLVSKANTTIDAGTYNVIINASAVLPFDFSGSAITIKTANYVGGITTTGSITLAGGAAVTGSLTGNVTQDTPTNLTGTNITGNLTYNTNTPITITLTNSTITGAVSNSGTGAVTITLAGTSTVGTAGSNVTTQRFATVTAANLLAGSRVRVYDNTNSVELYNGVLSSAGFTADFTWVSDKTITLTATYCVGTTAKLPVSATGVLTRTGAQFLSTQATDTVYASNGVDGSAVTEFSTDFVNVQVDVSDADNATNFQRLYAWFRYAETTAGGIANFFGAMTAIDEVNYIINSNIVALTLDNVNSAPVIISGAVMTRTDGASIIATTSHSIQINPAKAYIANSTGLATSTQVSDLPTLAEIEASTVLAKEASQTAVGLKVGELHAIHGLAIGMDLVVTKSNRVAGTIQQSITEVGDPSVPVGTTVTVSRSA